MNEEESPVVQECIDIVARRIAWAIFDYEKALWEDYPDIGEDDWDRVVEAVEKFAPEPPNTIECDDAYRFLARSAV